MDPNWIDTHCHLDAPEFAADVDAVDARARAAGVHLLVLPAVRAADADAVRALAHRLGHAYALGIHPLYVGGPSHERGGEPPSSAAAGGGPTMPPLAGPAHADNDLGHDLDVLRAALQRHRDDPRLVAVGEIGLDFFVPGTDRARQERAYRAQLQLAREFDLPVLLHVRRSADALLAGLRRLPVAGGIAHAFNGSAVQAGHFAAMGFGLGFGGAMTHERARQIRQLAATVPATALVLETDAPDIPPAWLYRTAAERAHDGGGHHRNEPAELPRIARTLAALRGWSPAQTARITTDNACRLLPRLANLARRVPGDGA